MVKEMTSEEEFSLAKWNKVGSSSSSNASSKVAIGAFLMGESSPYSYSPPEVESRARNPRAEGSRRRASVNSLMGLPVPVEVDNSIGDSSIANMNRVFLRRACEVVCDSVNLGMTFEEPGEKLCEVTERILRNI